MIKDYNNKIDNAIKGNDLLRLFVFLFIAFIYVLLIGYISQI